jgi:hypothetical protein
LLQKSSILAAQIMVEGVQSVTNDVDAQSITSTTLEETNEVETSK